MSAKRSINRKDSNRSNGGQDQWMTYNENMETLEVISDGLEEPCISDESAEFSTFDRLGCARETEQIERTSLTQQ